MSLEWEPQITQRVQSVSPVIIWNRAYLALHLRKGREREREKKMPQLQKITNRSADHEYIIMQDLVKFGASLYGLGPCCIIYDVASQGYTAVIIAKLNLFLYLKELKQCDYIGKLETTLPGNWLS